MSNPRDVRIGEVTKKGDFYRITGHDPSGRVGSVEIPTRTLDSMDRKSAESLMKRGVSGTIQSEKT